MSNSDQPVGARLQRGVRPPAPMRAVVLLSLADLGVLAQTASRNDTHHAFQAVALEWCGNAQGEIERLRTVLVELVALREPNFQPYAEYQERVRLAWEAAERVLGPNVGAKLETTAPAQN